MDEAGRCTPDLAREAGAQGVEPAGLGADKDQSPGAEEGIRDRGNRPRGVCKFPVCACGCLCVPVVACGCRRVLVGVEACVGAYRCVQVWL